MSRNARRCRAIPVPDSSHNTTVLAPISIRLSNPNPASATDDARIAATPSTTTPTTFHANVIDSRRTPRRCRIAVRSPVRQVLRSIS